MSTALKHTQCIEVRISDVDALNMALVIIPCKINLRGSSRRKSMRNYLYLFLKVLRQSLRKLLLLKIGKFFGHKTKKNFLFGTANGNASGNKCIAVPLIKAL